MKPTTFDAQTSVLRGGPAEKYGTADDVADLPMWRAGNHIVSCWSLSVVERLRVLVTGRMWLHSMSAEHPPIKPDTVNPFPSELIRAWKLTNERGTKQADVESFWKRLRRVFR